MLTDRDTSELAVIAIGMELGMAKELNVIRNGRNKLELIGKSSFSLY